MMAESGLGLAAFGSAALAVSAGITGMVRRLALSRGVLDVPNERSSHSTATPRGGGIAIVLVCVASWVILSVAGSVHQDLLIALLGGGMAVALIGLVDDIFGVPAPVRLAVHLGAAVWAVAWLGGLPPLRIGAHSVYLGWIGHVLAVMAIVWALNLFNFMDGIDGIAAAEAVFVACAAAVLTLIEGHAADMLAVESVFAAACAGFLAWNWPPAKIFMGDVGSGFLGYVIAVLALAATRNDPAAILKWLLLGGVFFVDATVTLVRRVNRGERLHEAHRSHAYQWLARRWRSHRRVTLAVIIINLLWVFPCAMAATLHSDSSAIILCAALVPLVVLAITAGAGRREAPTP
jgi:Fuc2NAc and GlcNAc transferase